MESAFIQWKKQCLSKRDSSKKCSVDEDIVHIVSLLNSSKNYFTTSSCSGRVIVIVGASDSDVQKQNCAWLFVSHQKCQPEDVVSAVSRCSGDAVLKFEPFILHVQCRRLEDAQILHSVAVSSGFRNSGLTVGKKGKIITAVRSTHSLEVPLSHQGRLLVDQDYIHFLVQVANQKMEENLRRIQRFYQCLQTALTTEKLQIPDTPGTQELHNPASPDTVEREEERGEREERSVYKRRRKRGQTDCYHDNTDSSPPELEDCLHLFT